jgi:hypothetical protein
MSKVTTDEKRAVFHAQAKAHGGGRDAELRSVASEAFASEMTSLLRPLTSNNNIE